MKTIVANSTPCKSLYNGVSDCHVGVGQFLGSAIGAVEIAGDSEKNRRECVDLRCLEVGNVVFGVGDC